MREPAEEDSADLTGLFDLIRERADAAPDAIALLAPGRSPLTHGPLGPLADDSA